MDLRTTEDVRAALLELPRADWGVIALTSGVPLSTIEKIAYAVTTKPSFDSVTALIGSLRRHVA